MARVSRQMNKKSNSWKFQQMPKYWVGGIPEEEVRLVESIKKGNVAATEELKKASLPVMLSIVKGYEGSGLQKEELIAAANFVLVKTAKNFNRGGRVPLIAYATPKIRHRIAQIIQRNSRILRGGKSRSTQMEGNLEFAQRMAGAKPSVEKVSERMIAKIKNTSGATTPLRKLNVKSKQAIAKIASKATDNTILTITDDRPEHTLTSFEKIELIEEGISKKALIKLKEKADLDYDQLSTILNVARATLINKKEKEKFNKDVSDKILSLADIYSYGYEVFEERDRFNVWVFRENQALGGQAPFDLLHNSFGREEVKNLIGRIDHGIYS